MPQKSEPVAPRVYIKTGVANFIQKNRTLLVWLVLLVIATLAGLGIWTQVDQATKTDYASRVEKIQADFSAWQTESDEAKKKTLAVTLESELADIIKQAPISYGLLKAYFVQGNYLVAQKKWPDAAASFRKIFEKDSHSYLAPIALIDAGVALENANDSAGALAAYTDFEKNFGENKVLAPQAYFSSGRLLEGQNKNKEAVDSYKKLVEKFPDSSWTKLGRDRILVLGSN